MFSEAAKLLKAVISRDLNVQNPVQIPRLHVQNYTSISESVTASADTVAFCYLRVVSRWLARVILPELILDRSGSYGIRL